MCDIVQIGLQAIRANAFSAVLLWTLATAVTLAYCHVPIFAARLHPAVRFMSDNPYLGSLVSQVMFGGVLVWVLYQADRRTRPRHMTLTALLQMAWGCVFGCACVWFFRFQEQVFGNGNGFWILTKKVFFDQFCWTVLLSPLGALFNYFIGKDMSLPRCRAEWPDAGLRDIVLPNLVMNWCIWIPANYCVYLFPASMRIVVTGLLGSFWVLVSRQIGSYSGKGQMMS